MASFVNEVLSSAGQLETQEVQGKLDALTQRIESLKLQVHTVTQNKYVDFRPNVETSQDLVLTVHGLSQEMTDVADKLENEVKSQLNMSTGVVQTLKSQFEEASGILVVLDSLIQVQEALECISSANKTQDYLKAAEAILNIQQIVSTELVNYKETKILMALQTEYWVQKEKFLFDMGDKWKEMIDWNVSLDTKQRKKCEIRIASGCDSLKVLENITFAMQEMEVLDSHLKSFGAKMVSNFIEPCILNKKVNIKENSNSQCKILTLLFSENESKSPPSVNDMFSRLLFILPFLNKHLLQIVVEDRKESLMSSLGKLVSSQVLEMIVKECLTHWIPTSNKDLAGFLKVVEFVEQSHTALVNLNFISSSDTVLLDFVQNVNVLFANKKCQQILEKARTLMTSDIHNSVLVSDDKPLGELPHLSLDGPSEKKVRKLDLASECKISNYTFKLPTCHVSVCVQQLLCLAYETLQEATGSSPQCAIQMFYAVRNMLELFCSVFPTYHKKNMATFPHLSAIFHNDCMFVGHHLMTLGHQFSKMLPSSINATFVDLVPKIRKLGVEVFMQQLTKQKSMMSEYLKGAKGFNSISEGNLYFDAERAMKQIIHQLQHLQNVWREVLPPVTYRKAIGTLLNSVVIDITASIVILEDISSEDAKQIATLLTIILDKASHLMTTNTNEEEKVNVTLELRRNVPKWLRFKELITVLNASLLEIADRWADGKGPLAVEFSPNEMKQMIRALFQNTERRAAVLSKIK